MAFNVRKAAQVIAFLARERGDSVNYITAVKLAYLADRKFLELYDLPILNDELVSMEHGPVDSNTYDYIKGHGSQYWRNIWGQFVKTDKKNNLVVIAKKLSDDDFDELSDAEIDVLRSISKEFERFKSDPWALVKWIHQNCPEWENVGKTSKYLSYERVLRALGKEDVRELAGRISAHKDLEAAHLASR